MQNKWCKALASPASPNAPFPVKTRQRDDTERPEFGCEKIVDACHSDAIGCKQRSTDFTDRDDSDSGS